MSATKAENNVEFDDLLVNIKSTRNVNEIRKKLDKEKSVTARDKQRSEKGARLEEKRKRKLARKRVRPFDKPNEEKEEQIEMEVAMEKQKQDRKRRKVLEAPIHRQAQQRIEGKLAYRQTGNELRQWQPIVNSLRVAEQLKFPYNEDIDNPLRVETAEERAKGFIPRTELEHRVAEVLGKSKSNIGNDEEFSQAERELLKSMELKEARKKCEELRKMRALMSFHAAKLKRQSKIKSKLFHRIKKRHERRQLVKEVETLLVRDPKKASERIEELERDRAYERATLKHRGTNKWTKQIRKFASRNPELRKTVEDQLRLGRELKSKHGAEGNDDNSEDDDGDEVEEEADKGENSNEPLSAQKLVEMASDGMEEISTIKLPTASENPFYHSAMQNIRNERKVLAKKAKQRAAMALKDDGGVNEKANEAKSSSPVEVKLVASEQVEKNGTEELPEFLDLNLRQIVQIPAELAEGTASDTDVQHAFLAEAYEDDDVLIDFCARKKRIEEEERPKEKDSNRRAALMRGWGSWTGPGISKEGEKRRIEKRMMQLGGQQLLAKKRREQKRKDAQKMGLIIREQTSEAIQKLQPTEVPFPFTRIQDFEAYIQQPLGRDWNTPIAHQQLTQPAVVTKTGRIIHPLDKKLKLRKGLLELSTDE